MSNESSNFLDAALSRKQQKLIVRTHNKLRASLPARNKRRMVQHYVSFKMLKRQRRINHTHYYLHICSAKDFLSCAKDVASPICS